MDALKQLKLAKNGYIVMSILFMILGICLIIWPDCSMAVFCTAVGIMLIAYGCIKIIGYFSRDFYCLAFQFDLAFGVLLAAVGVIIIVRRNLVVNLIFGIFGVLMQKRFIAPCTGLLRAPLLILRRGSPRSSMPSGTRTACTGSVRRLRSTAKLRRSAPVLQNCR